jgi:hypothetical protein
VVEGRGRGPTDTVAAENFEFDISSDTDDICLFLYIINTLWLALKDQTLMPEIYE